MIPRNLYTSVDLWWETLEWEELATRFRHTFEFADDHPLIHVALQVMKTKIFKKIHVTTIKFHQCNATIHHWMKCYNVTREPNDDEPVDINIPYSKGMHVVEGLGISSDQFLSALKINKVNIGSIKNLKFVKIGDYWDDETIKKITHLLYEF